MRFSHALTAFAIAAQAAALSIGGQKIRVERATEGLQDIVTYDEHSLKVHGERIFVFSGEFHPFRLPVPDLWLDVFQKVKALGFNTVSFYVHWALLEGEPGTYSAEGIFAFEPFFEAAKKAGIYLIARPGPYINAEASGGGFPGWLQRVKGQLRTRAPDYLAATDNYAANIGKAIAKAQITNGGPIILFQPENEYSGSTLPDSPVTGGFPDPEYFAYVKKQFLDAGVIVPYINNDAWAQGLFAPGDVVNGTTIGNVDIYAHDGYPLGFDCARPTVWPAGNLPNYYHSSHVEQSPSTFYSIMEFQGGAFDPWGGLGFAQCSELLNHEFERVFYKNNYASGITLLNIYMIFGGTNWGNLGHAGGYTSYDYGSVIAENREIYREKYSELKLEAQFLKVSPAYLTASVQPTVAGVYTSSSSITTTPLLGNGSVTNFYIVRHTDYQQRTSSTYRLNLKTSRGIRSIPQLNGSLTLSGRDSKWHITDYDVGGVVLEYSTAEVLTWKKFEKKTILILYGGPGELHEVSVITGSQPSIIEGSGVVVKTTNGTAILNWETSSTRRVVQVGDLFVYLLDRNTAYNYWVPEFVSDGPSEGYTANATSVIVEAGYLVRSVYMKDVALHIEGDLNATVPIRVLGAPAKAKTLHFNSDKLSFTIDPRTGEWTSTLKYTKPEIVLPDLSGLTWKYVDDLPEIQASYDDSAWIAADHKTSNNPFQLVTPTSLYSSDYGFHAGVLVYRGHFLADGTETKFTLATQGGGAFGSSVWINDAYVGSWTGIDKDRSNNSTYTLPNLTAGKPYVLTVVVDNNGLDESWVVGTDEMKDPRGILYYDLVGRPQSSISWKLTGNLGGEKYIDKARGPLNEGGLYAERQGYTQPYPPNRNWALSTPAKGINKAGIAFYQASFNLDLPRNYDIPISFHFGNTTIDGQVADYRAQLWINGYQFGKYINNIGPQSDFPVPQGILNYHGQNWLAVEIWAQQSTGAHLTDFSLKAGVPVQTSLDAPNLSPRPSYSKRPGAY